MSKHAYDSVKAKFEEFREAERVCCGSAHKMTGWEISHYFHSPKCVEIRQRVGAKHFYALKEGQRPTQLTRKLTWAQCFWATHYTGRVAAWVDSQNFVLPINVASRMELDGNPAIAWLG